MQALADLIRWIIQYAVTGGFIHFLAVWLIVMALGHFTTLARVSVRIRRPARKKKAKETEAK